MPDQSIIAGPIVPRLDDAGVVNPVSMELGSSSMTMQMGIVGAGAIGSVVGAARNLEPWLELLP
jgi:hypothetical protein